MKGRKMGVDHNTLLGFFLLCLELSCPAPSSVQVFHAGLLSFHVLTSHVIPHLPCP